MSGCSNFHPRILHYNTNLVFSNAFILCKWSLHFARVPSIKSESRVGVVELEKKGKLIIEENVEFDVGFAVEFLGLYKRISF